MPNNTYILLSRSILDSEVFASQKLLKIWIWCLCRANYKDRYVSVKVGRGEKVIKVKRGQFVFGRLKSEEKLKIDSSTIYKIMKKLESIGNISINSSNQYSIVSVCKYDIYQDIEKYKVATQKPHKSHIKATLKLHNNTDNTVNTLKNVNKRTILENWLNYRKSIKKPITNDSTLELLVKRFNSEPIEKIEWTVNLSIENSYQGLLWDKYKENSSISPKPQKQINHYVYKCPSCNKEYYPREMKGEDDFDAYRCDKNACQKVGLGKDGKNMVGYALDFIKVVYKE